jgi:DNA-binding CsgD family transcriptional regulator
MLGHLVKAKLGELAERGSLSARERSVLTLLVGGRSVDDIAMLLQISPRTVKFHQTNLLAKLHAESRYDLLRLMGL